MSSLEPYFFIAFAALVAVGAFLYSFSSFRKARLIEDTPTSLIRSAPQGYVELLGATKPDQPKLTAPLTRQPCLWFDYKVEKYIHNGKKSYWRTIRSSASDFSFYLEDETGLCHVHPDGAYVVPNITQIWYGSSEMPNTAPGVRNSLISMRRYKYTEKRIHEGELLYALGWFKTIRPLTASEQARDHMLELLSIWKADQITLVRRFDKNGDGKIDPEEWELVRAAAAKEAREHVLKNYDNAHVNTLSQPEERQQTFIISTKSPEKLTKGFRYRGWFSMLAFFASLAWFGYMLGNMVF